MPAHEAPLSLEELLAKKKLEKLVNNASTPKTKFLTKTQRSLLKETTSGAKHDRPKHNVNHNIQQILDTDDTFEEASDTFEVKPNKRDAIKRFNFEWNEEDDTSKVEPIQLLTKEKQQDYSLEIPYRKKRKTEEAQTNLHWKDKSLDKMTERDWRILKEDYDINITGSSSSQILRSWNESMIPKPLLENLRRLGMKEPTPIQRATIPLGMQGKDVLGLAETGSGKTLSFLIPALAYVMGLPPVMSYESPYVLIMVPTRELAQQIEIEFQKFMNIRVNIASIVGGHTYDENLAKLEKGVEILVGTPGRLLDLIEKKIIELNKCYFLVADEADRMIDMGFEKQVKSLIESLPDGTTNPYLNEGQVIKRTTLMFTATMPPAIEIMINNYMVNPITVKVGNTNNAVDSIVQEAIQISEDERVRMNSLLNILRKYKPPVIVFVNYQKLCDTLYSFLQQNGFRPAVIHGGRSQTQREEAISDMKLGKSDVLIATDVAARGIDIPNVSLVVNFQMTKNISEYVHRIGRTGRAGKKGTSITFWDGEADANVLYDLKLIIKTSKVSKCPTDLLHHPNANKVSYIDN